MYNAQTQLPNVIILGHVQCTDTTTKGNNPWTCTETTTIGNNTWTCTMYRHNFTIVIIWHGHVHFTSTITQT